MADTRTFPVPPNFDLNQVVQQLVQIYQTKGFLVTVMPFGNGYSVKFGKNDDGIQKYVGLAQAVTANFMLMPGMNGSTLLQVDFVDAEWTGKIVGFVIGWVLCWIPWIPTAIGAYNQLELPKTISTDIQMLINGGGRFGGQFGGAPNGGSPYGNPQP